MLEQCREIVAKFNATYSDTLVMPQIVLEQNEKAQRLPGTDGKAKMSKSLGNCIYLSDDSETVRQKIMSMYTDPDHIRVEDPGKIEDNTVFTYLDVFSTPRHFEKYLPEYESLDRLKEHYRRGGLGDVKVKCFLLAVMEDVLSPIRQRRKYYENNLPLVMDILKSGSERAESKAAETLHSVRNAMKINYFDENNLQ